MLTAWEDNCLPLKALICWKYNMSSTLYNFSTINISLFTVVQRIILYFSLCGKMNMERVDNLILITNKVDVF
jgi:hypothetical protein